MRRLFKGSSGVVKLTRGLGQAGYGLPKEGWIVVAWKELLESFRDRRTMLNVVILPLILMPLVISLPLLMLSPRTVPPKVMVLICDDQTTEITNYLVSISDRANIIVKTDCRALDNYTEMILNGEIDLLVEVPDGFSKNLSEGRSSQILYYYDPLSTKSSLAIGLLNEPINSYSRKILLERLKKINLTVDYVNPVLTVEKQVTRSGEEVGMGETIAAMILPMMIGLIAITGAGTFAVDMVAGERERKTLEALFTNPISKIEILTGKFAALIVLSIISGLSTLFSAILGINLSLSISLTGEVPVQETQLVVSPSNLIYAVVGILLTVILGGLTGNAILVTASSFAKTFKEAEQYIGALVFVLIIPMILVPYSPASMYPVLRLLPITSLAMFARDMILGAGDLLAVAVSLTSSVVYLILFLLVSAKLFGRESVIFG
ncbi:MAG: ABC transporter permease [Candidatus Korarchaeum sp.]|nr:ABC transporter permease [Candidatus Korarchaeum sp.]MDW8034858.1 ABC transporter permease [Candidatus Korarchaeum sp.]